MQAMTRKAINLSKKERFKAAIYHLDQVKAELCRRSFFYFMQKFWDVVAPDEPVWNWHIEYLCNELQEVAKKVAAKEPKEYDLIINQPPGTTKSLTVSVMFPAWCWTNWHWMRFITASYSGGLSLDLAEKSRDILRSEKFKKLFPELSIKRDKDAKSNFKIQKTIIDENGKELIDLGGNRFSSSVGGTVTGYHGHMLIVDDPLNPEEAVSEVALKTANRFMSQTLSTRKIDKKITPTIMVMQRLHEDDPTGNLLNRKNKKIRHICLPGEIRNYKDEVKPPELVEHYVDDLLDPDRMGWDVINELESDLGQYGFAGQIGQKPTPPSGGMFKVDHFIKLSVMPPKESIVNTVRYWDKAGTEGAGAFTRGTKMHKLKSGRYLISDVKGGQWGTDEREAIIKETAIADGRSVVIGIEQEPGSGGKESAQATIKNLSGFIVYADRPTGDKVYRADPYSVQVNNGNVYLLNAEWNKDFIEEHRFFPLSKYKDQVDSAAGAFNRLANKRQARMSK
jgi:predicted phage terminase large subunit-like protein